MATHSSILLLFFFFFTLAFLPGESHGQRRLAGYSSRVEKESDTEMKQQQTCILKDAPDYSLEPCVQ